MTKPKDGTFYATSTLLGGCPDTNSRTIWCWGDDIPIITLNAAHTAWTPDDAKLLQDLLERLNGKWKVR